MSKQTSALTEWPGAFGLYKYSREAVQRNLGPLFLITVLSLIVSIPSNTSPYVDIKSVPRFSWLVVLSYAVAVFVSVCQAYTALASVDDIRVPYSEIVRNGARLFFKTTAVNVLVAILVGIAFILLIVPGFIVLPRLLLAQYFVIDKNMGIVEAIKASYSATHQYAIRIYAVIGVNIAMTVLFITIIGIPFAIYLLFMYSAAFALTYRYIVSHPVQIAS